jgi:uncharacterized phage protein (TIGR01671 family)
MREIKFRIYDKQCEKVIPITGFRYVNNSNRIKYTIIDRDGDSCTYTCKNSEIEIMQYTGQHDRNGKEIYEGDLIFIDDVDGTFTVKWNDYSARLEINGDGITADFDNYYGYECEVVGNIYENKELLEGGAE